MVKRGLGKGLGELLAVYDLDEAAVNGSSMESSRSAKTRDDFVKLEGGVDQIEIEKIEANPNQPRKNFDIAALQELANSIKLHGVIQPIVINKMGDKYMIIAGERRYRASKLAGLKTIPAIVKNYTDSQIKEISIIENLQREDLNVVEAARAIKELMEEHRLTQEVVADRIGKSRPAIANLLRLLSLPTEIIELLEMDRLSQGHAKCLLALPSSFYQIKLANMASDNKLSVRELEKAIKDILEPSTEQKKEKPAQSLELRELVSNMARAFATKVSVLGNDNKGRIYIDYYNRDDLDRIESLIGGINNKTNK